MTRPAAPAAEPPPPPPPTHVEITAGGHQVIVEAVAPLNTVARKALELWQATDRPADSREGEAVGFTAEQSGPRPLMPPEVQLPDRICWEGDNENRRRRR